MIVKYLHNSFKKANHKRILTPYLFYLQLKSIGQPELICGDIIKTLHNKFGYSPASISSQLKQLVKCGFASEYKHENNKKWKYVLTSYRKVWNILGFRFKAEIETYRYIRLNIDQYVNKSDLKAFLTSIELEKNKDNQDYRIESKINRKIEYHTNTLNKTKSIKIRTKKEAALKQLDSEKQNLKSSKMKNSKESRISCKRAAVLMGYKTPNTSVNLIKKCEKLKFLSVKRNKKLIASNVTKIHFNVSCEFDGCYWQFGKVYKNECNIYTFLNNTIKTTVSNPLTFSMSCNLHKM